MSAAASVALVTGASGFLGRHLCTLLVAQQWRVRALARRHATGPWERLVLLDLEREPLPEALFDRVDTVFHLAGRTHAVDDFKHRLDAYREANVEATRKLLTAAIQYGVKVLVFVSSVKAMGEGGDKVLDETSRCAPETAYGITKYEAERMALSAHRQSGLRVAILRLPLLYGAGVKGNLANMLRQVDAGRFPPLPEFGNRRSLASVDDAARLLLQLAVDRRAAGQLFILTDGRDRSTREIVNQMRVACGRSIPRWSVPRWGLQALAHLGDWAGGMIGRRMLFDSSALAKLTGSAQYSSSRVKQMLDFEPRDSLERALPLMLAAMRHPRDRQ